MKEIAFWSLWAVSGIFLMISAWRDWKEKILDGNLFFCLLLASLPGWIICGRWENLPEILFAGLPGALCLFLGLLTKEAVGYGDGLTVLALGIILGSVHIVPMVLSAFTLCALYGLWKLIICRAGRQIRIPFLPFLLAGYLLELCGVILRKG